MNDSIIKANPNEHIDDYLSRLDKYYRGCTAKFNGVTFEVPTDGSIAASYYQACHQAQVRYQEAEAKQPKIIRERNNDICSQFLSDHSQSSNIPETTIMDLLQSIGKGSYYDEPVDPSIANQLIQLLEENGYQPASESEQYKVESLRYRESPDEVVVRVGDKVIVTNKSVDLSTPSNMANVAISNAMVQLALGKPLDTSYDFAIEYNLLRDRESQTVTPFTPSDVASSPSITSRFKDFINQVRGDTRGKTKGTRPDGVDYSK